MGKVRPRAPSRKGAKRWPKGQSSNSNPETKKYRNQARTGFGHSNSESSRLTTDAVKRLDALQGLDPSEKIEVDDDEMSTADTFKTFNTYASTYSNCSNVSFSRFLNHFQSSSLLHKEMLAILAAVTEIIKENGGTESSTEYYAALMITLEKATSEDSIAAILSLLGMGLKTVPKNVLKAQFGQASQVFITILQNYADSENFLILRHCIGCLSVLMRAQEPAMWSNSSTLQILNGVLAFTTHSKPKVRKAAQHAVCAILKGSELMKAENPPAYHPAAPEVAKHCLKQFEDAGKPGTITSTLHILTLLKDIIHQLPKSYVKSICEGLLRIMTLNNVLVTSCCLQTFHSLFISRPTEAILPPELNAQIINALYDYQPAPGDTQPTLAWLAVMQEAHANLVKKDLDLCAKNIHRIIDKSTELWLSDKTEIITAASHTIKSLLQLCLGPLCESDKTAVKYHDTINRIVQSVRLGMKYQYHLAWHHVLHLLAVLFQVAGAKCQRELLPILSDLAELRDTHKFTYNSEVEYAVGAAVKAMGPEIVLAKISLVNANGVDLTRSWLLPVLKDCVSSAPLSYFIKFMVPLADICDKKSKELKAKNDGIGSHSYELLNSQIWSLLPNFCNDPPDIKDNFKDIARLLGLAISYKKDLRISVMTSLRKLITRSVQNKKEQDIAELSKFAKNYLPLLFTLYTTIPNGTDEEGHRLAAFDTIKVYLTITPPEICKELLDKSVSKMESSETDDFTKQAVFDLIRVLVQFTSRDNLQELYNKCTVLFMSNKQPKEQKKAYRFLEEILGSDKEICKEFIEEQRKAIQKTLIKAATSVCTISKGSRLRCIDYLVKSNPQLEKTKFLEAIVPEVVMCVKELNEKCRTTAYQLLNDIADKLMGNGDSFDEYIQIIVAGLGSTPAFINATLLSLASLTYKYTGCVTRAGEILEHTCTLLTGPAREIVLSALCYVKVYISSFPRATIGPNLQKIMKGLTGMTEDCKRHFRQKVRDILVKLIRKFGIEPVAEMIPQSDEIMHKRIKNIRKIEARKQKAKEDNKSKAEESDEEFNVKRKPKSIEEILADSDEDFDDTDNDGGENTKKKQPKIWIKENEDDIVDFTDPSAMKNITTTKPGQANPEKKLKAKNHGFKTDASGRLIIKDSDDESEEEKVGKKKKQLPFLGSDSDDAHDSDADDDDEGDEPGVSKKNRRKRKLSGSTDAGSVATTSKSAYKPGGSGIHRPLKTPKIDKAPGAEYRSKKAPGDIKKKGKPDPYAYLPLTRASLNRRKKMKNASRFKGVISGAKKGVKVGKKARRKM
ncbi:RRP12-like protein [Microplitis demolitor]|uniref:RRP12-like protein n=1 Tax=Microplitis demolitor TaxID=69319 RepID=UPI0004CCDFCF|nr:RRP12-like protein [Microplitis demolitor]